MLFHIRRVLTAFEKRLEPTTLSVSSQELGELQKILWIILMVAARSRFDFSKRLEESPQRKNKRSS
jgi:hypothetical protein